jgi:hypothetical protein
MSTFGLNVTDESEAAEFRRSSQPENRAGLKHDPLGLPWNEESDLVFRIFMSRAAVKDRVGVDSENLLNILLREFGQLWHLFAAFSRSSRLSSYVLEEEEKKEEESGADDERSLVWAEAWRLLPPFLSQYALKIEHGFSSW